MRVPTSCWLHSCKSKHWISGSRSSIQMSCRQAAQNVLNSLPLLHRLLIPVTVLSLTLSMYCRLCPAKAHSEADPTPEAFPSSKPKAFWGPHPNATHLLVQDALVSLEYSQPEAHPSPLPGTRLDWIVITAMVATVMLRTTGNSRAYWLML